MNKSYFDKDSRKYLLFPLKSQTFNYKNKQQKQCNGFEI